MDVATLSRFGAVVGLDLWIRTYPGGEPIRDIAHVRLTDAFRALVGPGLLVRAEVPIGDPRDLRAWDLTLTDPAEARCGVELETRLIDGQDQIRRLERKRADGDVTRILLVVADTRANRFAIRAAAGLLSSVLTIEDNDAREALAASRIPPRDALLLVHFGARPAEREQAPVAPVPRRRFPSGGNLKRSFPGHGKSRS